MSDNEKSPVVGIDLGTTCSCVSKWDGREPVILVNSTGKDTTPSCVYYGKSETLVGDIAITKGGIAPERFVSRIKREMGNTDYFVTVDDKKYSSIDVSNEILKKLINDVNRMYPKTFGFEISGAVVTVPYYFKAPEREATLEAGEKAGLNILGLINEPTAAALAYIWQEYKDKEESDPETIFVFDLGGGTFDVTIFKLYNTKEKLTFEVIATGGDARLGGTDFDEAFQEYILKKTGFSLDSVTGKDRLRAEVALEKAVCVEKENLSSMEETFFAIPNFLNGNHLELDVTRAEFVESIQKHINRISDIVQDTLSASGLKRGEIDRVIKIGGSSRIPAMSDLIYEITGNEPFGTIAPDLAVAKGASIYAAILDNRVTKFKKEIEIKEIVSHALGVKSGTNRFAKIIQEGRRAPCESSNKFRTIKDNQTELDIEVYQGRGDTVTSKEVAKIGHILINGLLPKKKEELTITITFMVNNDQNISVIVEQPESEIYVEQKLDKISQE